MKYRKLDENGDYVFGSRKNMFHVEAAAVGQAIETRLKLLLEEWWENTEDGLPLFQQILGSFGGGDNLDGVDLIVQERILTTPNVVEIKDFQRDFKNRKYSFTAVVKTIYGDTNVRLEEVI